jgi:hypothetical protein
MAFQFLHQILSLIADSHTDSDADIRIIDNPLNGVGDSDDGGLEMTTGIKDQAIARAFEFLYLARGSEGAEAFIADFIGATLEFLKMLDDLAMSFFAHILIAKDFPAKIKEVGASVLPHRFPVLKLLFELRR